MLAANTIICIDKSTDSPNMPDEIHDHLTMSFTCKGFMSYCLRQKNGWQLRVTDVIAAVIEQKTSIYSIIRKLMALGYITRHQERFPNGRMGQVYYHIHDKPQKPQFDEKPASTSFQPEVGFPEAVAQPEPAYIIKNNLLNNNLTDVENCSSDFIVEETDFFLLDWQKVASETAESDFSEAVEVVVSEEIDSESIAVADQPCILESQHALAVPAEVGATEVEKIHTNSADVVKLWPCHDSLPKSKSLLKHCLSQEVTVESALGESLTANQQLVARDVAHFFAARNGEKELYDWITLSLLSPLAFNGCKTFLHKLNAIIKKIKDGSFCRPRYSTRGPEKPLPEKNALSAAHSIMASKIVAVKSISPVQSLEEEVIKLGRQLSSSIAAESQFRNCPKIADMHKKTSDSYREQLDNLRTKLNGLKNTPSACADKDAFVPVLNSPIQQETRNG